MARIAPTANAARGLKKAVAVGMVLVGRSRCRPHANPHDDRRKDIARKLKSRRNDGRRARQQADGDVPARQNTAYANADDDDAAGRSIRFVNDTHIAIVDAHIAPERRYGLSSAAE